MLSWGLSKCIETKLQTTCFCLLQSLFKNQKEVRDKFPCLIFCMIFEEKYFSCYIAWLPLLREILGNMCIVIACLPGCDVINFEINLIVLIKPFFVYKTKKSRQNFKISWVKDEVKSIFHHFWRTFKVRARL